MGKSRGDVEFQVGDKSYKLRFSTHALEELEEKLNMSVNEIGKLMATPEKFRMRNLRVIMWAGLVDHQPGITDEEITSILSEQLAFETTELISRAFGLAFPQPAEGGTPVRPPEEARATTAGNGSASSVSGNP